MPLHQLVRFLFHGSKAVCPKQIALSEPGLDIRYANQGGAHGAGIYFADNAAYSMGYVWRTPTGEQQLLLCAVIVGESYKGGG